MKCARCLLKHKLGILNEFSHLVKEDKSLILIGAHILLCMPACCSAICRWSLQYAFKQIRTSCITDIRHLYIRGQRKRMETTTTYGHCMGFNNKQTSYHTIVIKVHSMKKIIRYTRLWFGMRDACESIEN